MRKTMIAVFLVLLMALSLTSCGSEEELNTEKTYEIAMITDSGKVDDKAFNQEIWAGITAYAKEHRITHKNYRPVEKSTNAYLDAIEGAVESGARVVVVAGTSFEEAIFNAQELYEDVNFILVNGYPNNRDYANLVEIATENTVGIKYAEEQAGYLAGYAAVKEGYTKLAFMGEIAAPGTIRFGYGFVQGADAAAVDLGLPEVEVNYHYTGSESETPETRALAESWYAEGTEVIFACGDAVRRSVILAAEEKGGKVIGSDVDHNKESKTMLTSAVKGVKTSVQLSLTDCYEDQLLSGNNLVFAADQNGVLLPMKTSKFKTFSQADYEEVFTRLAVGEIEIQKDTDASGPQELQLSKVNIL